MKIRKEFTPEQAEAIKRFEEACESNDLYAIGYGRKSRAYYDVHVLYTKLQDLGIADAITPKEADTVRASKHYI